MPLATLETLLKARTGGIWHAPALDAKQVKALAKKAKYAFFHVDGRNVQRKEQLMNALATALALPGHFGRNWDALEECLTDLEWVDGDGYVMLYEHVDPLAKAHPDQLQTLVEVLRDAVASWAEDGTAMIVLLTGEAAPDGVERLA